jgi:hypothetical protein
MPVADFETLRKQQTPDFEFLRAQKKAFDRVLSGDANLGVLFEPEDSYLLDDLFTDAEDRDKFTNILYLSDEYQEDPNVLYNLLADISRRKWGQELSQPQIKQKLYEERQEKLRQYYRDNLKPFSVFGQAFMQSLSGKPAMAIRGVQPFTPGEALGFDGLLRKTSDYLENLHSRESKQRISAAEEGKLWPKYEGKPWYDIELKLLPEVINSWAATVGDQIPIMLMTWSARAVGKVIGKPVGVLAGTTYALATAGPDPHDIVASPVVAQATAKVIEHLSGAAPLIAMEAGGFMDRADSLGIDKDIRDKYARLYGLGSGAIEYAQVLWNLKAFKRLSKPVQKSIMKRVLLEIGGNIWEGMEEFSQNGLENFLIGKAIEEQKTRTPEYDAEKPETWAGGRRAFAVGFGVSMLTRMPGHALTSVRRSKLVADIQDKTGATEDEAKIAVNAIAAGGTVAEEVKKVVQEQAKERESEAEELLRPRQGRPVTPESLQEDKVIGLFESEKNVKLSEEEKTAALEYLREKIDKAKGLTPFRKITATAQPPKGFEDFVQKIPLETLRAGPAEAKTVDVMQQNVAKYGKELQPMFQEWLKSPEGMAEKEALGLPEGHKFEEISLWETFNRQLYAKPVEVVSAEVVPKEKIRPPMGYVKATKNLNNKYEVKYNSGESPEFPATGAKFTGEFDTAKIARKSFEAWWYKQQEALAEVPVAPTRPTITAKEVSEAIAGNEQLSGIQQRLDEAYRSNDVESFRNIIDKELAPLPSDKAKNILQGHAEALQMEMESRAAKPAPATIKQAIQEHNERVTKWIEEGKKGEKPAYIESLEERKKIIEAEKKEAEIKNLRSRISALAKRKGLTKKAFAELKMKHIGFSKMTGKVAAKKITVAKLQKLYKALEKFRPKRIGYFDVVTKKTEDKIQSLRQNLTDKALMTSETYKKILDREVHGKEPKYVEAESYITEQQGKEIIKRMLDEAEVLRTTESFDRAVENDPEIMYQVDKLNQAVSRQSKRDPHSLESMRYYNQQAEVKTGAPFYAVYQDLINTHLENSKTRAATWKHLEATVPNFKEISGNEDSLARVAQYIASQGTLENKPESPKNITAAEITLAQEIQKIFKDYEIKIRTAKFFNYYYYNQAFADYNQYKKEINKAVDIYESKGKDALIAYLKTQEFGVIKSGYEPLEKVVLSIKAYTPKPVSVGKGHIKVRTDVEYHTQERNILQRLSAYMRQVDMLFNMSPKINAYVRLFDDNFEKFDNPQRVQENIEFFLTDLKRYNIQKGFFERTIARAYSQAMRVIIMPSPVLSFRNLFQNLAFEHDKSILIDPRNKSLTDSDIDYLETYVLQTRGMVEEYFMVGEKPVPGLKTLTKLVDKVKIYPYSDIANRHWCFWAKKNQVDRAFEKTRNVSQIMKDSKLADLTHLEQKMALGILARDGKDAFAQYVARVHVDDIHFLYERAQRSPAEQTTMGRVVGNLMLFPRAYTEKLLHQTSRLFGGASTVEERVRAAKTIFAVVAGGLVCGSVFMIVTGRKKNPYDPFEIFAYRPGGLALGALKGMGQVFADTMLAISGNKDAQGRLTSEIPRLADVMIPFYDYVLRGYEAMTDQKNVDVRTLRRLRELLDREYQVREIDYIEERDLIQKWQYFFAGPGIDEEENKEILVTIRR